MQTSYNRCISENKLELENMEWIEFSPATNMTFPQTHIFMQLPGFIFKEVGTF